MVARTGGLLALALAWEPARDLFRFGPLHFPDLAICLGAGILAPAVLELVGVAWRKLLIL